jgi:hypothetical protein
MRVYKGGRPPCRLPSSFKGVAAQGARRAPSAYSRRFAFDDELLPPGEGEGRQLPSLPVVNWLLRPLIAPSPRELGKWAAIFGGV